MFFSVVLCNVSLVLCGFVLITISADESQGELNQYCLTVQDCRRFGYMCSQNKTCQCARSYLPNLKRDKCVGGVDQKCKYDEHCIEGAFCQNQATCKCKDDFEPMFDGTVCSNSNSTRTPLTTSISFLLPLLLLYYKM